MGRQGLYEKLFECNPSIIINLQRNFEVKEIIRFKVIIAFRKCLFVHSAHPKSEDWWRGFIRAINSKYLQMPT